MATNTEPGDWMENAQTLANIGHGLAGLAVPAVTALFVHTWTPLLIVEFLLAAYVLGKEYWYDLRYETGETVASSTEDALGYLAGNFIGCALLALACALGTWVLR
jgi:hypothetical protein